jgi:hypothetical protein
VHGPRPGTGTGPGTIERGAIRLRRCAATC